MKQRSAAQLQAAFFERYEQSTLQGDAKSPDERRLDEHFYEKPEDLASLVMIYIRGGK
jgi:hypothetical protein